MFFFSYCSFIIASGLPAGDGDVLYLHPVSGGFQSVDIFLSGSECRRRHDEVVWMSAGHQRHGWIFEVAHLHQKSGSLARPSDFALDLRRIAARQQLPGYLLQIEREDGRELLRIRPVNLSTVPVDNGVNAIGTSGARGIGTSGASLSADQAHEPQLTLWPEKRNPTANLSNRESNSFSLTRAQAKRGAGSARRGEP